MARSCAGRFATTLPTTCREPKAGQALFRNRTPAPAALRRRESGACVSYELVPTALRRELIECRLNFRLIQAEFLREVGGQPQCFARAS